MTTAFTIQRAVVTQPATSTRSVTTTLNIFGKKKEEEDLSYIETRDMTREEMVKLNQRMEDQVRTRDCLFGTWEPLGKKMAVFLSLSLSHTHTHTHTYILVLSRPFLIIAVSSLDQL